MKKFTFKTEKPTGRYRSFQSTFHYIKLKGETIGTIGDDLPHSIRLQVTKANLEEDGNKNCPWKWVKLRAEFASVDEAKQFLTDNIEKLLKLNIHTNYLTTTKN